MFSSLSKIQDSKEYKKLSGYSTDRDKEEEYLIMIYGHEYPEINCHGERLLYSRSLNSDLMIDLLTHST
jgi:hypothetical protein